jgi:hypothetical protein
LGILPIDNDCRYLIKQVSGNLEDTSSPIKVEVYHDGQPLSIKEGFSFKLKYADSRNEQYELTVQIKHKNGDQPDLNNPKKHRLHLYTD